MSTIYVKNKNDETPREATCIFSNMLTSGYTTSNRDPAHSLHYYTNKKIAYAFDDSGLILPAKLKNCDTVVAANNLYEYRHGMFADPTVTGTPANDYYYNYMFNTYYNGSCYRNRYYTASYDEEYWQYPITVRVTDDVRPSTHPESVTRLTTNRKLFNENYILRELGGSHSTFCDIRRSTQVSNMAIGTIIKIDDNTIASNTDFIFGIKGCGGMDNYTSESMSDVCYYYDSAQRFNCFASGGSFSNHANVKQIDTNVYMINATASNVLTGGVINNMGPYIPEHYTNFMYFMPILSFKADDTTSDVYKTIIKHDKIKFIDWYIAMGPADE